MPLRQMADIVHDRQVLHDREPVTLAPGATVQDACRRMRERKAGAALVIENGRLVGIFTGRDAVRHLAADRPGTSKIAEAMTRNPATITAGQGAVEALRLMQDCGCRHLPVIEAGRVVGVVSRGDFRADEQARLDEETGYYERLW